MISIKYKYTLLFTPFIWSHNVLGNLDPKLFPVRDLVSQQVSFWEKIFTQLPSTSALIHDLNSPQILIDLVDHHKISKKKNEKTPSLAEQSRLTNAYLQRYREALKNFKKIGEKAKYKSAIEMRVFDVYKRHQNLNALLKGRVSIRAQAGLSDQLIIGGSRAQKYLVQMEKIFKEYKKPKIIKRHAFVESMFNNNARSKVGASGIWQFMRPTASNFIIVNNLIDERNSPLKATRAAAKLLAENYKLLGTWPLAITAYNHGPTGLLRAVRKLRTKNLNTIIRKHKSTTFGYASRNFYSEFIAVARSYQKFLNQGLVKYPSPEKSYSEILLHKRNTIPQTLKKLNLSWSTFRTLNPGMTQAGRSYYNNHPLPKKYQIIIPSDTLHSFNNNVLKRR